MIFDFNTLSNAAFLFFFNLKNYLHFQIRYRPGSLVIHQTSPHVLKSFPFIVHIKFTAATNNANNREPKQSAAPLVKSSNHSKRNSVSHKIRVVGFRWEASSGTNHIRTISDFRRRGRFLSTRVSPRKID